MSGIILEDRDDVIEVNEGFIDGHIFHFARIKSIPGIQVPSNEKSTHYNLDQDEISGTQLALSKKIWLLSNEEEQRDKNHILF